MQQIKRALLFGLAAGSFIACQKDDDSDPVVSQESELLAGTFSVYDEGPNAFGHAGDPLSAQNELLFFVGNSFFNQNWVMYGASTTARDGLGPTFNERSCSGCHFKDGRGRLPEFDGERGNGFLIRLSIPNPQGVGSIDDPVYGGQLQNQSIQDSITPEGEVNVRFENSTGSYPDGTTYSLRKPIYLFNNLGYGEMNPNMEISGRVANQMIGLGLLDAISEQDILANVDEGDANQDGISGKANYVYDIEKQELALGRFGWKSNMPNVTQQTAGAFHGDLGITSYLFPLNNCPSPQNDCFDAAFDTAGPEIEDDDLKKVALYSATLAVPVRRNYMDANVIKGRKIFSQLKCNSCHKDSYVTGIHDEIPELSGIEIHPYTDLLLHDMGDGLADNRPDHLATGNEWRTPPLWGIGLFGVVNKHTTYLHDGRARNIEEAILWHGGEAEEIKNSFKALSKTERSQLLAFLNSL
jgi:CxxC motif-containing protein (DUF1111 family)